MSETVEKRGRGRPRTLPADRRTVRCVVTPDELAGIQEVCAATGMSQSEFSRRAVVYAVKAARGKKFPEFLRATIDK